MSRRIALTRRTLLASLGATLAWRPAVAAPERPRDVGIGGTGFAPDEPAGSDRGIGGTGFVGTIQRFGSIVVNDSRIAYPPGVSVTIDGRTRAARELRIGHVVRVLAQADPAGLTTQAIVVDSEVVGPVTALYRDGIDVLGQRILLPPGGTGRSWRKRQLVAVSGLRRLDGIIAASLVEPRVEAAHQVIGVVERDADGHWIDGLKLLGLDESAVGRRVLVRGRIATGGFAVESLTPAPLLPGAGPVSLESYVGTRDGRLHLGSGLSIRADSFADKLLPSQEWRAVLDGRVRADGTLQVDDIRFARASGTGGGEGGRGGPSAGFGRDGLSGRASAGAGQGAGGRGGFGGPGGGTGGGNGPGGGGHGGGHGGGGPGGGGPSR